MEGKSSLGMKENIAGLLCYLAHWVTGLIFFLTEKESKFVKFHAVQSMVTFISLHAVYVVISILAQIPVIGFIFSILTYIVWLLVLIFWIAGMITAYQGKMVKFPVFGDIAESFLNKQDPK